MNFTANKELSTKQVEGLIEVLKTRFNANMKRHEGTKWYNVEAKLKGDPDKLWSLHQMESTGGQPDVVDYEKIGNTFIFFDCAPESPKERCSLCYDKKALDSRKANKPKGNAMDMATEMGIELLTESQYRSLQKLGEFDTKTSSWLNTPLEIRKLGGAIFGDFRFETVFIYHNGAESYYAGRGFRGVLKA